MRSRRPHSLRSRVRRALVRLAVRRPLIQRTGPAWVFGLIGLMAELWLAPVVLAVTLVVGLTSYLLLDSPWSRIRAQQRPRFVSVRILYLNTMIVAGFWLAVMFVFSAADPAVSSGVEQRLPVLLNLATARDLHSLVAIREAAMIQPVDATMGPASTWFDVFMHGVISSLTMNFLLFGAVITRRRVRAQHGGRTRSGAALRYDSMERLFVDEDSRPAS